MAATTPIHFTGDPEADAFLGESPLALMIGFVLDQQVTVQKAFSSPLVLAQRLGGLDAKRDRGDGSASARGRLQGEAGAPPLPGQHGPAHAGVLRHDRERVRRRRRCRLERRPRRRRSRAAPAGASRDRRDEGAHDHRRDREAPRRPADGLGGVRAVAREPRRRRLPAGARGVPGGQARPQGRVPSGAQQTA